MVVYLRSSKDEIEQSIRAHSVSEAQKKQRYAELQMFMKNRDELLDFLRKQPCFRTVNAVMGGGGEGDILGLGGLNGEHDESIG
jgi:hypothetical protein